MFWQVTRRLAVTALGFVCLGVVAAPYAAPVRIAAVPAASGAWLTRLNAWRSNVGEIPLTENTTWSAGDYDHSVYMVKNNMVTHYETPGTPYYTTDGDTAARNGNIYVSSSTATTDDQAIDWWMAAPFHELGMMDPRMQSTGFGSYREVKSGWDLGATLDTLRGNSFSPGSYANPVFFPGNGTTEPLTTYGGNEFPDPLQACPGYSAPTGLPLSIQVGGNIATTAGSVHSFTGNGVPLAHCVIDSNSPSVGSNLTYRGAVVVIPQQPLQTGVKYVVSLTVNGVPYSWSFSVGPFNACTGATATVSPASVSTPGQTVTFNATSSGCTSPLYEFWLEDPSGNWSMKQPFSTNSSWAWNTTGYPGGTYTMHAWANQAGTDLSLYQVFAEVKYVLPAQPACTAASLSPSPGSFAQGTPISFAATATGCANPQFEYWVLPPGGYWQVMRAYSTTPGFGWSTSGLVPGAYQVAVWVRQQGDGAPYYDVGAGGTYTLTGCTSASLTPAPGSFAGGSMLAFTASASGCSNPEFEYWVLPPGSYWQVLRSYGTGTFSWNTSGLPVGSYQIAVWARQHGGGTATYETAAGGGYTLTGCTSASVTPLPGSFARGSTISFSAGASGCSNP
ncbi:MAG TPA: CAP domain-containing protein, partial [Candidatus Dormibacteraeota bacterium]|nr:CAP domain-containing protein [Candidatus Dormibacteraeota bacterium]